MPNKVAITNAFQTTLALPMTALATTATVASAIPGASASDAYDCSIDAELISFTACNTTTWTVLARPLDGGTAVSHLAGRPVTNALWKHSIDHLVAVQQGGTLEAIGRVLDFTGGAVVTQEGDGVVGIAVAGTTAPIVFVIDGGGSAIATGSKGYVEVPFACTITANRLMADQSGSIVVTVKKANYATMPTTTSIVASAPPTLSSAQKSQDSTLVGWTTSIAAGDWLEYVVASASVVTRVTVSLTVKRV